MSLLNAIVRSITAHFSRPMEVVRVGTALTPTRKLDDLLILQGRTLALANADRAPLARLQDAEFKVFSQFGEDGILQYLIRETRISRAESSFVEFGVHDYAEANTRFLMENDHWRGLVIDGSAHNILSIRSQDIFWRHDLTAVEAWIDRDNINQLVGDAGFSGEIGLLSVDIDGNDYWVWERLDVINPVIVVIEWNSVFGSRQAVSVPYDATFKRAAAHYSHLFYGASICAFSYLAGLKGYSLLCSNSAGNNLFFVRNDRLGRLSRQTPLVAYVESRLRESRNASGSLNFLGGDRRRKEILDIPLVDVVSGRSTTLRTLQGKTGPGPRALHEFDND